MLNKIDIIVSNNKANMILLSTILWMALCVIFADFHNRFYDIFSSILPLVFFLAGLFTLGFGILVKTYEPREPFGTRNFKIWFHKWRIKVHTEDMKLWEKWSVEYKEETEKRIERIKELEGVSKIE